MQDIWGYQGKRVVINGGTSGMGLAAVKLLTSLGAEVHVLGSKELPPEILSKVKFITADLRSKESIDAALQRIPGPVDKIFACAGVPGRPFSNLDIMLVNFVGHRHMVESLLPRMVDGGAIAMIASVGAIGWQRALPSLQPLLATHGFDEAQMWLKANPDFCTGESRQVYALSKQCLIAYAKKKSSELSRRGIRINTLSPGATMTPMMSQFEANASGGREDVMKMVTGIGRYATPEEQGHPLVFLNSDMASYISGHDLIVDFGFAAGMEMRGFANMSQLK